jgi:dTDP-4-dehydrorhamnose 3,5-epimerase
LEKIDTTLPDVWILRPRVINDRRGFFMESYNQRALAEIGIRDHFVQDNHSRSSRGVLRGLHYQLGRPQAKLVRVTRGSVFDVAVDVRRGSPNFGRWVGVELSADNHRMLYVPRGFAHGLLVLSESTDVQYKCSDFFAPQEERGVAWNDPSIGIQWPLDDLEPILSDRDRAWCTLDEMADSDFPDFAP